MGEIPRPIKKRGDVNSLSLSTAREWVLPFARNTLNEMGQKNQAMVNWPNKQIGKMA